MGPPQSVHPTPSQAGPGPYGSGMGCGFACPVQMASRSPAVCTHRALASVLGSVRGKRQVSSFTRSALGFHYVFSPLKPLPK